MLPPRRERCLFAEGMLSLREGAGVSCSFSHDVFLASRYFVFNHYSSLIFTNVLRAQQKTKVNFVFSLTSLYLCFNKSYTKYITMVNVRNLQIINLFAAIGKGGVKLRFFSPVD